MSTLLAEPALHGLEMGSARWFAVQRDLIARRPLVKRTYDLWYQTMLADAASVPKSSARVLELGSGANYVKRLDPSVVTSDVVPGSDLVVDARALPFEAATLRAIFLTHVFHHIPEAEAFLREADRTLVPGGVIALIDVAHTPFARLIFGKFHPEAYEGSATEWKLRPGGAYGGANQAMSWIVFVRDKARFERRFPSLRVECVELLPWFGYLISGGLTRRNLIPSAVVPALKRLDAATTALNPLFALHWHIRVRKAYS